MIFPSVLTLKPKNTYQLNSTLYETLTKIASKEKTAVGAAVSKKSGTSISNFILPLLFHAGNDNFLRHLAMADKDFLAIDGTTKDFDYPGLVAHTMTKDGWFLVIQVRTGTCIVMMAFEEFLKSRVYRIQCLMPHIRMMTLLHLHSCRMGMSTFNMTTLSKV